MIDPSKIRADRWPFSRRPRMGHPSTDLTFIGQLRWRTKTSCTQSSVVTFFGRSLVSTDDLRKPKSTDVSEENRKTEERTSCTHDVTTTSIGTFEFAIFERLKLRLELTTRTFRLLVTYSFSVVRCSVIFSAELEIVY